MRDEKVNYKLEITNYEKENCSGVKKVNSLPRRASLQVMSALDCHCEAEERSRGNLYASLLNFKKKLGFFPKEYF